MNANILRRAIASDAPEIQRIRHAVRENRLVSTGISDRDVLEAIEKKGRGWVVEVSGKIAAFAFYESAGWHLVGPTQTGDLRYEMRRPKNDGGQTRA